MLYDYKVLVEKDFDEIAYMEALIKEREQAFFGLIIFPTEECNLRCVYCYEKFISAELTRVHYDLMLSDHLILFCKIYCVCGIETIIAVVNYESTEKIRDGTLF